MYWTHELFRMYRRIEHIGSTLSVSTNISIWMSFAVMKIFYLYIDATKRQKTVAGGKIACSHTSSQWTNNFICFVLIFFKIDTKCLFMKSYLMLFISIVVLLYAWKLVISSTLCVFDAWISDNGRQRKTQEKAGIQFVTP